MNYILSIIFCLSVATISGQVNPSNWFTDKEDALQYTSENHNQILMVFAGSDWCRPCIKFKKDILESEEFANYSKGNIAVLYLDFPSKKKNKLSNEMTKKNEALAEQFNTSGTFPKIILMDEKMNKIKEVPYEGQSPDVFINALK